MLRVDADALAAILVGIIVLGVYKSEAGLDRIELVAADAAIENLLAPLVGIEFPAGLGMDQRDREREIVGADDQRRLLAVNLDRVLGVIGGHELVARCGISDIVARRDDVLATGAKHF